MTDHEKKEKELFLQKYLFTLKTKVQSLMNEIINLETQLGLERDKVEFLSQENEKLKKEKEKKSSSKKEDKK
jgi:hypothetical protein